MKKKNPKKQTTNTKKALIAVAVFILHSNGIYVSDIESV
jgi:hypothetical protein